MKSGGYSSKPLVIFFNLVHFFIKTKIGQLSVTGLSNEKQSIESTSLGPAVNILAIVSNANILKNKRIKIYHIKGIDCQLLISMSFLTKERKNKKEEENDQTGTQAKNPPTIASRDFLWVAYQSFYLVIPNTALCTCWSNLIIIRWYQCEGIGLTIITDRC